MAPALPSLVLFEGLPGSGKTTTSHEVVTLYAARGVAYEWTSEEDKDHPFFGPEVWRLHRRSDYDEICLARWQHVVDSCEGRGWVLDACAMQSTVRFMFEQCWSFERIAGYWRRFEDVVAPIGAVHVSIAPGDPEAFVRLHTMNVRAGVWPKIARHVETTPAGQRLAAAGCDAVAVEFWVRSSELCNELHDRSRLPVFVLDPGDGWVHAAHDVMGWLGAR